jgi:probable F420-dependent oxidoreductase
VVDIAGPTGIWSWELRYGDASAAADAAAELEALGYGALWFPDAGGDIFGAAENLLAATRRMTVATGILNVWLHAPDESAHRFHELTAAYGPRFLLGLGVGHARFVDSVFDPGTYQRPVARVAEFLDGLDAAEPPVPTTDRVIAALGPQMLDLARRRAAGTHPYLVTPELTAAAREALGPRQVVAVEVGVVLEAERDTARAAAREHVATYLELPNYTNNWKRAGFTDDDLAGGGSDRLVDALFALGDETAIARRVDEHRQAGASHVCIQVVTADRRVLPISEWRTLAPALNGR